MNNEKRSNNISQVHGQDKTQGNIYIHDGYVRLVLQAQMPEGMKDGLMMIR